MGRLSRRIAVVTGGGRGIGRSICLKLAEHGADVAVVDLLEAEALETSERVKAQGAKSVGVVCDVSRSEDVERMFAGVLESLGGAHILINNAGVAQGEKAVIEMTAETWDRVMRVNLRGHVLCTKAVGRYMIEKRYGKIINISSAAGLVGVAYISGYCASKAGMIQFTKSLALEWARFNIQVNAICPGFFVTDLNREFLKTPRGQELINKMPMRRTGDLREIRGLILLLASDASSFMTGSVVTVDGGQTI